MAKLMLPVAYKREREINRRREYINRLKDLGCVVAGADMMDEHGHWLIDESYLLDVMQKEEYLRDHPEAVDETPKMDPEEARQLLLELQAFRNRKKSGQEKLYY